MRPIRLVTPLPRGLWPLVILGLALFSTACGGNDDATSTSAANAPPPAPTPVAPPPDPQAPAAASTGSDEVEMEIWRSVKDSEHPEEIQTYLDQYPDGAFAQLARTRLERLQSQPAAAPAAAAATAPPPTAAPAPPQRPSRRAIVQAAIRSELKGFHDSRLHIAPDIPQFKLAAAASIHGFDPGKILLLWDDGFSGGGKTGFAISDRKIHWREVAGADALWMNLEDIEQVFPKKKKFLLNGYPMPIVMASNPRLAAERFTNFFQKLTREMRRHYG